MQAIADAKNLDLLELLVRRGLQSLGQPGWKGEGATVRQINHDPVKLSIISGRDRSGFGFQGAFSAGGERLLDHAEPLRPAYEFRTVESLFRDFAADVMTVRDKP
jgi:hypothetical protein